MPWYPLSTYRTGRSRSGVSPSDIIRVRIPRSGGSSLSNVRSWVLPETVPLSHSILFLVSVMTLVLKVNAFFLPEIVRPAPVLAAGTVDGHVRAVQHDGDLPGGRVRRDYLLQVLLACPPP